MNRLTFNGDFCDIAQCLETRGGGYCPDRYCSQRRVWERLKEYEDTGLEPEEVRELVEKGDKHEDTTDVVDRYAERGRGHI